MQGEYISESNSILIKNLVSPDEICDSEAKVFKDILEMLYSYTWESEPDYNKIIFMFEKIVLDMNIVHSSNNFDWIINIPQ